MSARTVRGPRTVRVDAARLARWAEGFGDRHGGLVGGDVLSGAGAVMGLSAGDGSRARLSSPFAWEEVPSPGVSVQEAVAALAAHAGGERACAVVIVRRGGYGVAAVCGDRVLASRTGTRHVQGRTAAGGWSQQRFARRRENQASGLLGAAVEVAFRILVLGEPTPVRPVPRWLVTGGDRVLVGRVLADPRLAPVAGLCRGPHLPVGDPRGEVVRRLPAMLRTVTVVIEDAPRGDVGPCVAGERASDPRGVIDAGPGSSR